MKNTLSMNEIEEIKNNEWVILSTSTIMTNQEQLL